MSTSKHQLALSAKDQTGAAFKSVQARAIATGQRIASVMGGAIAAAGAYLSVRAFTQGAKELGMLSDQAMKAGASVEELTSASTAFQVAGLNLPVDTLTKSLQYLQKQTGQGGMDNFYKTLEEIAKIEDPAQRGAELIKNFGRAGMELQPLVSGGEDVVSQMRELADIMPTVSQEAADAGDKASDAMLMFGDALKSEVLNSLGELINKLDSQLEGGLRGGVLKAIEWIKWFGKISKATFELLGAKIGFTAGMLVNVFMPTLELVKASFKKVYDVVQGVFNYLTSAIGSVVMLIVDAVRQGPKAAWDVFKGTWKAMNEDFKNKMKDTSMFEGPVKAIKQEMKTYNEMLGKAGDEFNAKMDAAAKARDERINKINNANVNRLATLRNTQRMEREATETTAKASARAMRQLNNQLMLAGSSQAMKLSMLGPAYENQQKEQTQLQKQIAKNTAKIASNTANDTNIQETDLGA